jgi:hypothetical protein
MPHQLTNFQGGPRGRNEAAPTPESDLWIEAEVIYPEHPFADNRAVEFDEAMPMAELDHNRPVPQDVFGDHFKRGAKRFSTDNGAAIPTFERAAHDFTTGQTYTGTANGGISIIVGRQAGRKSVSIAVPKSYYNMAGTLVTSPIGVVVGQTEGELQAAGGGYQLLAGDSMTITTEAPIWVGLLPGQTTGFCQWLVEYNPAGGELGGQ